MLALKFLKPLNLLGVDICKPPNARNHHASTCTNTGTTASGSTNTNTSTSTTGSTNITFPRQPLSTTSTYNCGGARLAAHEIGVQTAYLHRQTDELWRRTLGGARNRLRTLTD